MSWEISEWKHHISKLMGYIRDSTKMEDYISNMSKMWKDHK